MPAEQMSEVQEIVTAGIDKVLLTEDYEVRGAGEGSPAGAIARSVGRADAAPHPTPPQKGAHTIKEALDKKFGPSWHVCVGEGFGFGVSFNSRQLLYLLYGEKLGIVVFKA